MSVHGGRGIPPIFIGVVVGLLSKIGKKQGKREIIERPRAAIDANKALGRTGGRAGARTLSEEMRRVISLLDLDSFLRPRVFRLPLSLSLSRFTERRRRREIYRRARAGILNLGVYSFIGTIRPALGAH